MVAVVLMDTNAMGVSSSVGDGFVERCDVWFPSSTYDCTSKAATYAIDTVCTLHESRVCLRRTSSHHPTVVFITSPTPLLRCLPDDEPENKQHCTVGELKHV